MIFADLICDALILCELNLAIARYTQYTLDELISRKFFLINAFGGKYERYKKNKKYWGGF